MDIDISVLTHAHPSRIALWEAMINATGARTVAEIGVWKGEFAEQILRRCPQISRYYLIDPWAHLPQWNKPFNVDEQTFSDVYAEAMRRTAFASERITVLRGTTSTVIDGIADGEIDLAYIDGDHTLRGITIDLIRVLPKVRTGGIVGGDDFTATPWQHDVAFEPTLVCPFAVYFAEAMGLPVYALPHRQFAILNTPGVNFSFNDITGNYGDLSLNNLPKGWIKAGSAD